MTLATDQRTSGRQTFTFAEPDISRNQDEMYANSTCTALTWQFSFGHSRNSSNTSSPSSPVNSFFSSRTHSRWPSSSSSFVTTPESPANVAKLALHDLVEEPAEKDELIYDEPPEEEPMCICDAPFCEHERTRHSRSAEDVTLTQASGSGDRSTFDNDFSAVLPTERRGSGGSSGNSSDTRASRQLSSISRRIRERKATVSLSAQSSRSAPASRASSIKTSSMRQSLRAHMTPLTRGSTVSATAPQSPRIDNGLLTPSWSLSAAGTTYGTVQVSEHDPIEREELSPTPLLPPLLAKFRPKEEDDLQSPLQSPSIAPPSATESTFGSSVASPMTQSFSSPALSTRPSFTSLGMGIPKYAVHASPDMLPLNTSDETDEWSFKLGHANFHILPEPYVPAICDSETCNQLLKDWKAAQTEYFRQAARISEHYGPTSPIYKFACEKWSEIHSRWRSNFATAHDQAEANGATPNLEPLEETQAFAIPDKFPDIDDGDIVGPMTQYARVQQPPPKKRTFLRIFTDPASILRKP